MIRKTKLPLSAAIMLAATLAVLVPGPGVCFEGESPDSATAAAAAPVHTIEIIVRKRPDGGEVWNYGIRRTGRLLSELPMPLDGKLDSGPVGKWVSEPDTREGREGDRSVFFVNEDGAREAQGMITVSDISIEACADGKLLLTQTVAALPAKIGDSWAAVLDIKSRKVTHYAEMADSGIARGRGGECVLIDRRNATGIHQVDLVGAGWPVAFAIQNGRLAEIGSGPYFDWGLQATKTEALLSGFVHSELSEREGPAVEYTADGRTRKMLKQALDARAALQSMDSRRIAIDVFEASPGQTGGFTGQNRDMPNSSWFVTARYRDGAVELFRDSVLVWTSGPVGRDASVRAYVIDNRRMVAVLADPARPGRSSVMLLMGASLAASEEISGHIEIHKFAGRVAAHILSNRHGLADPRAPLALDRLIEIGNEHFVEIDLDGPHCLHSHLGAASGKIQDFVAKLFVECGGEARGCRHEGEFEKAVGQLKEADRRWKQAVSGQPCIDER